MLWVDAPALVAQVQHLEHQVNCMVPQQVDSMVHGCLPSHVCGDQAPVVPPPWWWLWLLWWPRRPAASSHRRGEEHVGCLGAFDLFEVGGKLKQQKMEEGNNAAQPSKAHHGSRHMVQPRAQQQGALMGLPGHTHRPPSGSTQSMRRRSTLVWHLETLSKWLNEPAVEKKGTNGKQNKKPKGLSLLSLCFLLILLFFLDFFLEDAFMCS